MTRTKRTDLSFLAMMINNALGITVVPYDLTEDNTLKANVGNYHLSGAYGGWALHKIVSEDGATTDVFGTGHIPKRELHQMMHAYLLGLRRGAGKQD